MKRIIPILAITLAWLHLRAAESTNAPLFEIRAVVKMATPGSVTLRIHQTDSQTGHSFEVPIQVGKRALLGISDLASARVQPEPVTGRPQVGITFTDQGRTTLAEVTRTHLNKQIAILVNGEVVSAPMIRTEIREGQAVIDGHFTEEQAEILAAAINKAVKENQQLNLKSWTHGQTDTR